MWLAESDTPGLSMTRAFGDAIAATVGIIAQPEIMQVADRLPDLSQPTLDSPALEVLLGHVIRIDIRTCKDPNQELT